MKNIPHPIQTIPVFASRINHDLKSAAAALALAGLVTLAATTASLALPNPASVHCVEAGGRIEIVREPAGERGICVLPDGRRVDEWEFYRQTIKEKAPSGSRGAAK